MKQLFVLLLTGCVAFCNAQKPSQTIKGLVTDNQSEKPLPGVTVRIEGSSFTTTTDSTGFFIFNQVPAGRVSISITAVGYQPATVPEVLVTTGKQVILDVALEQQVTVLNEVFVKTSSKGKGNVSNEYAGSSARSFNIEEVTRYAGGRNDPSKLVSNFAGVISNNDSRNDIVVRGNSPAGVLWRIEGLPSPNPNHFSTLGTTGGPVSALNTNALKTSDFYTGAFSAEYGNATAAVFDISLRPGNSQKHERTLQLNLFSGLEAMLEGPLNKNKKGASYLLGYRYSFVQLGQSLGLNVGTDAVPKYQDWVFNIQSGKSKAGVFSLFGMGGISQINFIGKDIDTSDFYSRKDQDTYIKNRFLLFGLKHNINIGSRSYLRTSISYSNTYNKFDVDQYPLPMPPYAGQWQITNLKDNQNTIRLSSFFNSKTSAKLSWRAGFTVEHFGLKTLLKDREGLGAAANFNTLRDYNDNFLLWQYFAQARYKPTDKIIFSAGLHGMNFSFNSAKVIEPRAAFSYRINAKNSLSISYGLHSQLQPLPVYLYQSRTASGIDQRNRSLGFSKAQHFVLGYENRFLPDWRIKAETYYQYLFDIPVEASPSGFSMLNAGSDFTFPEKTGLVNKGKGSNTGVEITIEKFLNKGYYMLLTGSVFNSKYKGSDGVSRNSAYNYGYAANLLAGTELKTGKAKRNAFTFDIRLSAVGGRYATPVDLAASIVAGKEVLDETKYNAEKLPGYFRLDTKFGYRVNSKKRKLSQVIYLDLQNVTNRKNIFLRRYNPVYANTGNVYQIGFFPDILYRIQF